MRLRTNGPDVNRGAVVRVAYEQLRGAVPPRCHVIRVAGRIEVTAVAAAQNAAAAVAAAVAAFSAAIAAPEAAAAAACAAGI